MTNRRGVIAICVSVLNTACPMITFKKVQSVSFHSFIAVIPFLIYILFYLQHFTNALTTFYI